MAYFLYNLTLLLVSPAILVYALVRRIRGKRLIGLSERLGKIPNVPIPEGHTVIWVHAASVGEVTAALPVIKAVRKSVLNLYCVLTVITEGGHEVASQRIGNEIDRVLYAPLDLPFAVRGVLKATGAQLLVVLETELWPNLMMVTSRAGVPSILVNGRISDRSFVSYQRFLPLTRLVLGCMSRVLAQFPGDEKRLKALGAADEKTVCVGNVKFDQAGDPLSHNERVELRTTFPFPKDAPVIVIGSTRQTDEEALLVDVVLGLRERNPNIRVIHAPRHVDRAKEVGALWSNAGFAVALRTDAISDSQQDVVVLDTFGELARVYAIADVSVIGNSFTSPGGGQNILQPLTQGVPVVYGPFMQNFRDSCSLAEAEEVAWRVISAEEAIDRLWELLSNGDVGALATRAVALVASNRGAADRCAAEIVALLGK